MACNCGKKSGGGRETYVATFTDGTTKTYATEVEARVATSRAGGTYRKQVAA